MSHLLDGHWSHRILQNKEMEGGSVLYGDRFVPLFDTCPMIVPAASHLQIKKMNRGEVCMFRKFKNVE